MANQRLKKAKCRERGRIYTKQVTMKAVEMTVKTI